MWVSSKFYSRHKKTKGITERCDIEICTCTLERLSIMSQAIHNVDFFEKLPINLIDLRFKYDAKMLSYSMTCY